MAIPFDEGWPIPQEMNEDDFNRVKTAFIDATKRSVKAGFDYLSRPERLQSIAHQQFNMKEILPTDIWNINDISRLYFEKN